MKICTIYDEIHDNKVLFFLLVNLISISFRVADLLLGGTVMNKVFQPHESHIPYKLQVSLFITKQCYGII